VVAPRGIALQAGSHPMRLVEQTRLWARRVKRDALSLWFARSHPDTPWHAKALGAFVVAYALSPIDLIPDFIPVLGYLDDVILLPVLIWLTVRLLPPHVLAESRQKAEQWMAEQGAKPRSLVGGVAIVLIWVVVAVVLSFWVATALGR
jgi:uncharacterized membrane protein YkvA (DUF1232 family)